MRAKKVRKGARYLGVEISILAVLEMSAKGKGLMLCSCMSRTEGKAQRYMLSNS